MLKKLITLAFVFMLAFYPVGSISAAPADEGTDNAKTENNESSDEQPDDAQEVDSEDEEESEENADENADEKSEDSEGEEDQDADENSEEESEDKVDEDADAEVNKEESTEDQESDEQSDEEESEDSKANSSSENEESEEADEDEEEISTLAEDEEEEEDDFEAGDIHGTASGDIEYDVAKGHYVLDLQAGFGNHSLNEYEIRDKWVAFALPNGVSVAEELPSGMIQILIEGKTGLAVKIPNISGSTSSEYVYKEVALTGAPEDNDPYENLRMLEVDTNTDTYDDLGEVKSQRDIDFSVMEENPSINLSGSVDGSTEFDNDNVYYNLNLTVDAKNNAYEDIDNLFAAFELPESVQLLTDDDISGDVKYISDNGKNLAAVRLPELREGKQGSETYQIPVIGKTDAVVEADNIQLYTFNESNQYTHVGNFDGNVKVDYSNMDKAWYFTSKSEVITDYPGVSEEQKGFRFNYTTRNLTVDDVDKVTMEFVVPNSIDIQKPEYIGSGVEIDWDGNTANVDLGNLRGGEGYEGYFTAVGNTSATVDDLKNTEVKVTLFHDDGTEEVKTIKSPFVEGKYDENDFGTPPPVDDGKDGGDDDQGSDDGDDEKPGDNGDGEEKPGDNNNNKNNNKDDNGNNNGDNGDNNGDENQDNNNGNKGNNDGKDNGNDDNVTDNNEDDGVTVEVEDGNDDVENGNQTVEADSSDDDNTLPETATNNYTMLAIGFALLAVGGIVMVVRRKTA